MSMRFSRTVRVGAGVAALGLSATGCVSQGLYGVSLPGGAGRGGYKVTVVFDNVLDLVPQAAVKVDDVTVGSVRSVSLTPDYKARVVIAIKKSVKLPANTTAILQQTSLLGEKFVELNPPYGQPPQGQLREGAVISDGSTTTYPDIEEVFGVLSSILNGGGLEKLQTINFELVKALGGREARVRDFLKQLTTLMGGLDKQKSQLVRAIDALDRLSGTLAKQTTTIDTALRDLHPGLKILADNRVQLTRMLQSLSRLGQIGSQVIRASKDATVKDLTALQPVLGQLAAAGQSLPRSFELLFDYPFPHNVTDGILGDYTNLYATLDMSSVCNLIQVPGLCAVNGLPQPPKAPGSTTTTTPGGSTGPLPLPVPVPSLPGLPLPVPSPSLSGLTTLLGGALQ